MSASRQVQVTHADRVLFPDAGITKGELVEHYRSVAPLMLPHLRDRPLTLQRFPRGIDAKGFIQQDVSDAAPPEWLTTLAVPKQSGGTVRHAVADRPEALVWLANMNCLTLHTWLSRGRRLEIPDRMVFDLDPSDGGFAVVRDTAFAVKDLLGDLGLVPYAQLTGSRGVHVVVPISGHEGFDDVRAFARDVAELIVHDDPAHRTTAARKSARGKRIYLDVMRNAYAQTAVAPYAVRARASAPVALPIHWDELRARGMRADRHTLRSLPRLLADRDDPWGDLSRHARGLAGARHRLARLSTKVA